MQIDKFCEMEKWLVNRWQDKYNEYRYMSK